MDKKQYIEEAKKQIERLQQAIAQGERLRAENEKLKAEEFRREAERIRGKKGAKPTWKGELGYELVCAIDELRAKGILIAEAIRTLQDKRNIWARYKPRELQIRYQEAKKHWAWYFERNRSLDAEMEAWRNFPKPLP